MSRVIRIRCVALRRFKAFAIATLGACALLAFTSAAHAQDIEPRAYANAPVGVNFLIGGYAYTDGGLSVDSSVPISDPRLSMSNAVVGYARVLDFWGKSAKFDVVAPFSWLSGSADYDGQTIRRSVSGFKALGRWTLEGTAAVTLYTDNNDFYGDNSRSQDPLYSLGTSVIYSFRSGAWASLDGTYFAGGRTTLNRELSNDLQQNWRVGATLAFPVNAGNSVKAYASRGVSARTGNNYDLVGIAWQYSWGGGL
jgi:hypothetical protein